MPSPLSIIVPFPESELPRLWEWLCEYPDSNLSDQGPRCVQDLAADFKRRYEDDETVVAVVMGDDVVGAIGYMERCGQGLFKGICFSRSVHGTGIPLEGVRLFIRQRFESGSKAIHAAFYADNIRIYRFLAKLGAKPFKIQGLMPQVTRGGIAVTWKTMRLSFYDFQASCERGGHGHCEVHSDASTHLRDDAR